MLSDGGRSLVSVVAGAAAVAEARAELIRHHALILSGFGADEGADLLRRHGIDISSVRDQTFDAVLLCYVLHHAHDARLVLNEVSRVLRDGGLAIIYEDMPAMWWDRIVCWTHDRQWRGRTGSCTFQLEHAWRKTFNLAGFEIVSERALSRWRNLAHPVARRFFVIRNSVSLQPAPEHVAAVAAVASLRPQTAAYVREHS